MSEPPKNLELATSPFAHKGLSTPRVMLEVIIATIPVLAAATYFFGITALLVTGVSVAGCVLAEWGLSGNKGRRTLLDGSAILTGLLLGLTLPPAIPLWMAFLGGLMAVSLGKMIFGGLGQNLFNPALVGRAFLQAAFPIVMTTWTPPLDWSSGAPRFFNVEPATLAPPLMRVPVDGMTGASPLGMAKFEDQITDTLTLVSGQTAGSLGETAGVLLIIIGLWLGFRRVFDWRLPLATLLSVTVFSGALYLIDSSAYPSPLFMLLTGGLLFGAVFMVTDPVTTPMTSKGAWIFGIGTGFLVVLIRVFGGLPEGVMYAILLMNSVTPLIDRYTQPKPFGHRKEAKDT
jgi:electron transport complex protein RnfD